MECRLQAKQSARQRARAYLSLGVVPLPHDDVLLCILNKDDVGDDIRELAAKHLGHGRLLFASDAGAVKSFSSRVDAKSSEEIARHVQPWYSEDNYWWTSCRRIRGPAAVTLQPHVHLGAAATPQLASIVKDEDADDVIRGAAAAMLRDLGAAAAPHLESLAVLFCQEEENRCLRAIASDALARVSLHIDEACARLIKATCSLRLCENCSSLQELAGLVAGTRPPRLDS